MVLKFLVSLGWFFALWVVAIAMNLKIQDGGLSSVLAQLSRGNGNVGPHSHGSVSLDIIDVAAKGTSLAINTLSFISEQGLVDRSLSLELRNGLPFKLINPKVIMLVGVVTIVPPVEITADGRYIVKFEKVSTWWVWKGASGCLSYDLGTNDGTLFVAFNVPFDVNSANRYNIRVTDKVTKLTRKICKKMIRAKDEISTAKKSVGRMSRVENGIIYYGRMTTNKRAQLLAAVALEQGV